MGKDAGSGGPGFIVPAQPVGPIRAPNIDYDRIRSILNSNVLGGEKLPTSHVSSGTPPPSAPPSGKASDPLGMLGMIGAGAAPSGSAPATDANGQPIRGARLPDGTIGLG